MSEHTAENGVNAQCVAVTRRADVVREGKGGATVAAQEDDVVKAISPICFYGVKL